MRSVSGPVSAWRGSAPRKGLPTPRSRTRQGTTREVHVQHRRRLGLLEPRDDGRAVRERRQAARLPKDVVREAGVDAVEPLERLPGGGLAHRDVGVARRALRPHRRARHAHREAGAHEREEVADLLLLEREGGVVARDDRGRRGERVLLPEQRVGGRDRRLRHEQPVVHVAEVEEARHRAGVGPRRAHDHVVVVRVAVDHSAPKAGERGHDLRLVAGERPLDERATPGVGHVVERAPDPRGAGEVPREVAVGRRVLEVPQGPVHLAEEAAQVGEQLRRARAGLGQRRARQPGEHEDEAGCAVRSRGQGQGLAGGRGDDAGQGQVRARGPRRAAGPRTAARRAPDRARGAWPSARRAARPARPGGSCRRTPPGAPAPRPRGRNGPAPGRPRPPRSGGGRAGPRGARAGLCYTCCRPVANDEGVVGVRAAQWGAVLTFGRTGDMAASKGRRRPVRK